MIDSKLTLILIQIPPLSPFRFHEETVDFKPILRLRTRSRFVLPIVAVLSFSQLDYSVCVYMSGLCREEEKCLKSGKVKSELPWPVEMMKKKKMV